MSLNILPLETTGGGGGGGGVSNGQNLGAGEQVFKTLSGSNLQFRTLTSGSNVSLSTVGDEIQISATTGSSGYPSVTTYNDLPVTVGTPPVNSIYLVTTASGVWLISRKPSGLYRRIGNAGVLADWEYLGNWIDAFNDDNFRLYDGTDTSKQVQFQVSGISASTTRTLTPLDKSYTLEETGHQAKHQAGGSDALTGNLDATARVGVKSSGTLVANRRAINFIPGSNVTLTVTDDGPNEEVDVTIAAAGGGGGGTITGGTNLGSGAGVFSAVNGANLEFKSLVAGTNVSLTPSATEISIAVASAPPSGAAGGSLSGTYPNPSIAANAIANTQVAAAAAIVESKLALNFPTHSNANDPTAGEKAALVGTSGAPGAGNAYVTNADARLTDSRPPSGTAGGGLTGSYPNPTIAANAISNSQVAAAAGIVESKLSLNFPTHSNANDPTAGQKAALAGTNGTPGAGNTYVTDSDPRNSNSRTPSGTAGGSLAGSYPNPTLTTTGVTAAAYGSADAFPTLTVQAEGRLTAAGTITHRFRTTQSLTVGSNTVTHNLGLSSPFTVDVSMFTAAGDPISPSLVTFAANSISFNSPVALSNCVIKVS